MPSIASIVLDHYNGVVSQALPAVERAKLGGPDAPYRHQLNEAEREKRDQILVHLRQGAWDVVYDKVDGTPATMCCTLDPSLIPPAPPKDPNKPAKAVQEHLLAVYALDRSGWRSFAIRNVRSLSPHIITS